MNLDLIFCLSHCKPVCCYATQLGFLYGVRSDDTRTCGNCKVDFVDIDFKRPNVDRHIEVVKQFKPKYAVVLDIMQMSDVDIAVKTACDFADLGVRPIVVPKVNCLSSIPHEFILGYSIPTRYGGTDLDLELFTGRKIHLLGGSPKRQAMYYNFFGSLGCSVVSADSNTINKAARKGTLWKDRFDSEWAAGTYSKYEDYYHRTLCESLKNVWAYWQAISVDPARGQLVLALDRKV